MRYTNLLFTYLLTYFSVRANFLNAGVYLVSRDDLSVAQSSFLLLLLLECNQKSFVYVVFVGQC